MDTINEEQRLLQVVEDQLNELREQLRLAKAETISVELELAMSRQVNKVLKKHIEDELNRLLNK